jgi:preprotein translocase subunit SecE
MAKPQAARPASGDRTMARTRTGPFDFLSQVRAEGDKVTWPSRKETLITAAMVFVMVIVASAFFLVTDLVLQKAVGLVLGLGG